ncbi:MULTISPECIES: alpha-L-rhamnosidase [unclassified Paenibacillus]|uniref:alpha-L-rhamnosidase n=1 Tax=unclassified Paenibacillus TaxID=185978 RepID=UPI0009A685CE|nr:MULTISPECIES: alpha-L-rhamnosidase [unclassified Paenibacillus]SLK20917.1 alpha-L-rhamnosidase [Paenibacillus sp. RU5A]SOC76369.1 alpha-L-rhamnosidase [Paenibacillus sp. RU26A]SOC77934.1 alpha-L-rhamnosidase [Paenibacillus sp. RU5M]
MKITNLKTNHVSNPLGFAIEYPSLSYVVTETTATKQIAAQIEIALDEAFINIVFVSGKKEDIDSLAYIPSLTLAPRTRYYWRVRVWNERGEDAISETAWFETAKQEEAWTAQWITPELDSSVHPVLKRSFEIAGSVVQARAYVCGLGVYEMTLNGAKVGDEYLAPHYNAYHKWLQYQTYDITDMLQLGTNTVDVGLGNGWYKGRFGFEGDTTGELYGDHFALLSEIIITYTDGTEVVFKTDTSWRATRSQVLDSNIYDGEIYDATLDVSEEYPVKETNLGYERLMARKSLPVVIKETLKPIEVLTTPAGETVIDMGQNMVGWLQFRTQAPRGSVIHLQYGEVLQDGHFYRENLRSAKAEYTYTSDGNEAIIRPYFTFYGFRYIKVEGWIGKLDLDDFTGCVVYSDMDRIGYLETSHSGINRLYENALWGQKGNFLDTPTDCPQRDERMGWTGDAQVFSGTANFNMDTYAFFNKYGHDLWMEQEDRDGMVPMVIPVGRVQGGGSSAWGDAATIIPWNSYVHSGDKGILEQQFDSMKAWVDFIKRNDDESGGKRLWTVGFHFGDWLALDGDNPDSPMGGTDTHFVASAYYAYSADIVAKAAKVLGHEDIAETYVQLALEVRAAIKDEFFTSNGRLAVDTQTAYAVALFMNLVPEQYTPRIEEDIRMRLRKDQNHLRTGFVGTPYLNRVLSEHGSNDIAYTLLLNDDYPSWLYAVNMGATTIWERWNSILPDGKISEDGMNSLNHYAYGAVVEWMYRNMAGINPVEDKPGFRHALLAPLPDFRIQWVKAHVDTAAGRYKSEWRFDEQGHLFFSFSIPFNATATIKLPHAQMENVTLNGVILTDSGLPVTQEEENTVIEVSSGTYEVSYAPSKAYKKILSTHTPLNDLLRNEGGREALSGFSPVFATLNPETIGPMGEASIRELASYPSFSAPEEQLDELDRKLAMVQLDQ